MDLWKTIGQEWDKNWRSALGYLGATGDLRGAVGGLGQTVVGKSIGEWAGAQLGKTLGSAAGPVGMLVGDFVGRSLFRMFQKPYNPAPILKGDQLGGINNLTNERLADYERKAMLPIRLAADRAARAIAESTNSDRRLQSGYEERLPQIFSFLNDQIGQTYQRVYQTGMDYDLRKTSLKADLATRMRELDLKERELRMQNRVNPLQWLGFILGQSKKNE